ncbi:hypothetical protein [Pseudooceanicola spongiae]|uniref:Uncharacterized protein n=1 Tax=Pseudooceanicola spongiae TaxID=2613965 RepID=A0A7L9WJG4_9RHOB|nr:hypothetical protein [Pseudooceanicola spongiae]QOL80531.1 hypothetical protein F3W81_06735 [Pseudooceanicola spongiae]
MSALLSRIWLKLVAGAALVLAALVAVRGGGRQSAQIDQAREDLRRTDRGRAAASEALRSDQSPEEIARQNDEAWK